MDFRSADVRCATTGEQGQAPARTQTAILFGLLLAVQFAAELMPQYLDLDLDELDSAWNVFSRAAKGTSLAWPPLLAVWAVFGPQRAAVRLPLTLWLAMAVDLCSMYGWSRDVGDTTVDANTLGLGAAWLFGFLVLQLALWPIRSARGWRLKPPEHESVDENAPDSHPPRAESPRQFSLRALLGWTLAAALLLAGWRCAAPDARFATKDIIWSLSGAAAITPRIALGGLPVVALAWTVLAVERRLVLCVVLGLAVLAGLAGAYGFSESIGQWLSLPPIDRSPAMISAMEAGAVINGLLCLGVARVCGYRLRRNAKKREGAVAFEPQPPATISGVRFALTLAPLIVIAASLAWSVPQRLAQWRRAAIEFGWSDVGLEASFAQDGTPTGLECRHKPPLPDEICRRIASLADLRALDLAGSTIDDRQLVILAPLARLESLNLSSTAITDAGLEQLAQFPELRHLNLENTAITDAGLAHLQALPKLESLQLSLTEVTDDGLPALGRLPALKDLDVQLTAVSAAAAESFRKSHAQTKIGSGACFESLLGLDEKLTREYVWHSSDGPGQESHHFRIRNIKLKRLHARGRAIRNGEAEAVNNVNLICLVFRQNELEELDLRDSEVNDLDIYELIELKKLKRLDLRGSQVTDEGAQELARALPNCVILR
ncbi:MAG TPA: hypothetical protein VMV10_02930 [Pirellulales bacterium]|nr:hypothetical protein [Pirellulales bacterium]